MPAIFRQEPAATVIQSRSTLAIPTGYETLDPLRAAGEEYVAEVNALGFVKDEQLPSQLRERTGSRMFSAGRTTLSAAMNHQRQVGAVDADLRKPAASIDRSHDAERRARFRGMKEGAARTAVATADLADLAALTLDGNLADLPQAAFDDARERFLVLNTVEKMGLRADYALKPRLESPLASGVDHAAAEKAAEEAVQHLRDRRAAVAVHERTLRDYARWLAGEFNITPDAAWRGILGD